MYIENYKAISKISLTNIPNFVVIVGENGVGKSSIFDAIAFTKNMVSPYSNQDTQYWQNRMLQKNPIKIGKDEMKISLNIEPTTDEEKKLTENNTALVEIALKRNENGEFSISKNVTNRADILIRSWGKQKGIGGFEYIPANRIFREGRLALQSQSENKEQFYTQRTSQLENKFQDVKQKFVNFKTHDAVRPQDPPMFPEAQELVKSLLGKKVDVDFDENMAPQILVETENGSVDIDSLSDGQRELFLTYVGLHTTKLSHSVILFDEPDLHLHASMQKKALQYLIKFADAGNQIFLTTHSLDMITETPENNLYHMSSISDDSQLKNLEDEKEKLIIYQKLGASKYTFVNFRKVIFVEGESDYSILRTASNKQNIRFHQVGGVTKVAPDLLTDASQIESFYMIKDKDFLSLEEVASQEQQYQNKIKFLRRRAIENYMLDSDELFQIYQKYGNGNLSTKEQMIEKLRHISTTQFEQTLSDYYVAKNNRDINFDHVQLNTNEDAEAGINRVLKVKKERLQSSTDEISSKLSDLKNELNEKWTNNWIVFCDGKSVLREFGNKFFQPSKKIRELIELVSTQWDVKQKLPQDIENIIEEISVA